MAVSSAPCTAWVSLFMKRMGGAQQMAWVKLILGEKQKSIKSLGNVPRDSCEKEALEDPRLLMENVTHYQREFKWDERTQ